MRHPSTVLLGGRADTATLINNEETRQIVLIWKLVFCFLFFVLDDSNQFSQNQCSGTSRQVLQCRGQYQTPILMSLHEIWPPPSQTPLRDPRRLFILTNTHMFATQRRQQKPQFLLDGLWHGTYIISELNVEKKPRAVNNYILDPGPVAMTVMATLHSEVLRYNSYLKIYCSATPTWPACSRSG